MSKDLRDPGGIGQRSRKETSGAGLRARDRDFLFEQQSADNVDQIFVIIAVNIVSNQRSDLFGHFVYRSSRFFLCRALGSNAKTALTLLGVGCQCRVGLSVDQRQQHCFQTGFPNAEHAQHAVIDHAVLLFLQQRFDLKFKHSLHFARRPRHRDNDLAVLLQREARRCARVVRQNRRSRRHVSLFEIVRRHLPARALVVFFEIFHAGRIFHNHVTHGLCDGFLG